MKKFLLTLIGILVFIPTTLFAAELGSLNVIVNNGKTVDETKFKFEGSSKQKLSGAKDITDKISYDKVAFYKYDKDCVEESEEFEDYSKRCAIMIEDNYEFKEFETYAFEITGLKYNGSNLSGNSFQSSQTLYVDSIDLEEVDGYEIHNENNGKFVLFSMFKLKEIKNTTIIEEPSTVENNNEDQLMTENDNEAPLIMENEIEKQDDIKTINNKKSKETSIIGILSASVAILAIVIVLLVVALIKSKKIHN